MYSTSSLNMLLSVQHGYETVFKNYVDDGVIDIDKRLKLKFDYYISRTEDVVSTIQGHLPPSRQSSYYVVLVKKGKGVKNIGDFCFPITDNTLFFVPNRVVHSSYNDQQMNVGYALLFHIDFFLKTSVPRQAISNRKIFKNSLQPYLQLTTSQAQVLAGIFESLLQDQAMPDTDRHEMIAVKILELLLCCDLYFAQAGLTGKGLMDHPLVEKFDELLDCKFKTYRNVQFYANSLNVHPNHLNFILKRHRGQNAKECIKRKVISESKYLLAFSNFIIKEIADKLGFDDPNNFSTFFQKCTGMPPQAYRISMTGIAVNA
jgi:AraC family transcriptional activator of pobA